MEKHINCIIIDDDPDSVNDIQKNIQHIHFLQLVKVISNAYDAFSFIKQNSVDLIFLDIVMEEMNGIQFLECFNSLPPVIVTSAYDKYALKAYNLNVVDYLLKPIQYIDFIRAIDKIASKHLDRQNIGYAEDSIPPQNWSQLNFYDFIFVKTKYQLQRINLRDILYIKSLSNYLIIKTETESIFTIQGFNKILNILPPSQFIRIHKSYVISLSKIDSISKNRVFIHEYPIPIGERYKDLFYNRLSEANLI